MTETLKVYRRSELQAVDDGCLHRYRTIWRDGVDDSSDIALIGIGFHSIKHRYILRLLEQHTPSDVEEARAAFEEGVVAVQTPSRLLPELRNLWDYHAEGFTLALDRFVAAEERSSSGSVTWAPDLVLAHAETSELEIKDDKSGWAPPLTEDELRGLFQARVYSYYGMQRWPGFHTYRFTINAIRWGKSTSVVFTQQELDNIERELQAYIAIIEAAERANAWPAVAGPACRFCALACPLVDNPVVMPQRFLERTQAEAVGAWVLAAEQRIRQAKKALKSYCASHGPVNVNGVEWNNRPVEGRSYPIQSVLDLLQKRGVAGGFEQEGLTISHSSLSKLFKQFPTLVTELAPYALTKQSYRFSAKRPGGDEDETDG